MRKLWSGKRAEYLFLLLSLCAALLLFLCNLGNQYLWQDEAQTALVSKTILSRGVPYGWDGRNYFSQEFKAEYGKNYIWKWHTWLPFYIVAGCFKLFGTNTFVARLPFALFGIATVFATYGFCKYLWQSRKAAATAVVLLLISVPFLVMSRQCRYYSMAAFFPLLSLYAYVGILDKKRFARLTFVVSSVLLFHTHYIYCATLLAAVLLHTLLFHRNRFLIILLLSGLVILINAPWIVWLSSMKYGQNYGSNILNVKRFFMFAGKYLAITWRQIFPPWLLLVIPVAGFGNWIRIGTFFSGLARQRECWQKLSLLLFFGLANIGALSIASPWPYLRYLMPLIPIFTIIIALLVVSACRLHVTVSVAIVVVMIFTGFFRDFLYEITHDYDGPVEGIVRYLKEHGNEDDIVLIAYGDMAVKFYTKMRVVGGLTAEDLSAAADPDWIIDRKYLNRRFADIRRFIRSIPKKNYRRIIINYPDIYFENREDPELRHFRTVINEDRVVIFQKIKRPKAGR
jgi:4-amino-4-deoxy-L-arabinose transferase-like glycosyltransferase